MPDTVNPQAGTHSPVQQQDLRALRRELHAYPELGFNEFRTAARVAAELRALGFAVETAVAGTGVVGTLRRGDSTRSIGLRADMDALPIDEQSEHAHRSRHPGVMHACGHDGHTAMLLGAARRLATDGAFDGTVHLFFQPAEEGLGGAKKMLEEGLLERHPCDAVYAMHNIPGLRQGCFGFHDGATMASSDRATIVLSGPGGHGAYPHRSADVVVAAASLVMALQTVVARQTDPLAAAVVTVGSLQSGHAANVIPSSATLELSIRALDPQVRDDIEARVGQIARSQAAQFGVDVDVHYRREYPVLVNHAGPTRLARAAARSLVQHGGAFEMPPQMGSEDFAYFLQAVPGAYLFIGNDSPDRPSAMVHQPHYDFNDENLQPGTDFWVRLTEMALPATRAEGSEPTVGAAVPAA